jgi:hypothetical protein
MNATTNGISAAEACRMEHQILDHVKNALRVTLEWQAPTVGLERKLSSVRFTLKSFQRHLERLMAIEEDGGYMIVVAEYKPNLYNRAVALRDEHDEFRERLAEIVISADEAFFDDEIVENVCGEISALLASIDAHDRKEIHLIQEAILFDEGGEG